MPETAANKKSASARGGGSHGISSVNQTPPQQPPSPPPPAQAPLAPESFNPKPTPPRVDPMELQLPPRPRRPVEGHNSPMDGKAYVPPARSDRPPKPIKPYDPATATPKEQIQHELEREWRLKHGVDNMGDNFNPTPKRDPEVPSVPLNPFECDPRASSTGRCAPRMPDDWNPQQSGRIPRFPKKKKGKFQMGKKPRKPFKMGVPRKERIRLLKEQAVLEKEKEKWKGVDPWGGGENFPRPPQDFEPEWFGNPRPNPTNNPRHSPSRRKTGERRPFGIL